MSIFGSEVFSLGVTWSSKVNRCITQEWLVNKYNLNFKKDFYFRHTDLQVFWDAHLLDTGQKTPLTNISWPGKTLSLSLKSGFSAAYRWIYEFKFSTIDSLKNTPHGISVSLEKALQSLISFSTQKREVDTKSFPEWRDNEANVSLWNSVSGPSPPAWLPHKGHQSSAETAQSRGLSVSAWVDICVHKGERGEKKERQRERELPT